MSKDNTIAVSIHPSHSVYSQLQRNTMKPIVLFFTSLVLCGVNGAKILAIFPVPARSHYILGSALMRGLAERGHDVTMISPFSEKNPPKNGSYRDVVLTGFLEERERRSKEMDMFEMENLNLFMLLPFFINMMIESTELTLNHTNVQTLLNSDEKFDLVIVEQFMNEALKGLAPYFNAPMIAFSTIGANTWVNMLVGNPAPPSYVPDALLSYSSNMTLYERTLNTMNYVYAEMLYHFYSFPRHEQLYKKYFPNNPGFYDTLYNASIVLLNSHSSTNQPVPYVPNMIDIGGYHVQPPKSLPNDLQEFLDNAKDGVIYFSLGSNLKSADLPPTKRNAFLRTFSKLKQKILWKWEEDVLPDQPLNVKVGKWLPQQDILAHPNVKLFISHGGLLSTIETIYHGVPVLTIPVAGDQKLNAQRVVSQGFGLSLGYKAVSEETLTQKVKELLENPMYGKTAKSKSEILHDRLVKPMDTAAYWVEYVIRHGGAPHLRVAGVDLPWYKYMLVDVVAFISAILLLTVYVFSKIMHMCIYFIKPTKQKLKRN